MEKFLNASFEADQNVAVMPLLAQGNYAVVSADGTEFYVVDTGTAKPVTDKAALAALLVADARNRTNIDAKIAQALAFPDAVRQAKLATEAKCAQYTGTDTHECTDRQTCIVACKSVPYCSGADGQSGPGFADGFWEATLEWTSDRKAFDELVSSYSSGLESLSSDGSAIDAKVAILDQMSALATKISGNQLFLNRTDPGCSGSNATKRCFEFCSKTDYSIERAASQKANLNALKSAYATVQSQSARTDSILAKGIENNKYLASRGQEFQDLKLRMQSDLRKLNESKIELAKKVTDPSIAPMISSLANFSAQIVAEGQAGLYRKALGKKSAYEARYKEVDDRITSETRQYDDLVKQVDALSEKVGKGAKILGAESTAGYTSRLMEIKSSLTTVTLAELASAKSDIEALKEELTEELAAKATGDAPPAKQGGSQQAGAGGSQAQGADGTWQQEAAQPPAQSGGKPPCAPALVMLGIGALAFLRKQ
ncbi:MAG: hypothetical protein QW568_02740 [Candidatus Anstonellaceae archaeon]